MKYVNNGGGPYKTVLYFVYSHSTRKVIVVLFRPLYYTILYYMLLASFLIYQEIPDVRDVSYFFRHVNEYEPIIHKTVRFSHTYFHIVHDLARPLILIR